MTTVIPGIDPHWISPQRRTVLREIAYRDLALTGLSAREADHVNRLREHRAERARGEGRRG